MQFFVKKYLISITLIFILLANSFAQENKYSFTWLDRNENKMAGALTCSLVPQAGDGQYQLILSVTWFNEEGKPILDANKMPYLSLSKYDLTKDPSQFIRCTTFEQKKPASLGFQTQERLSFQVLSNYEGDVRINARFQYALNKGDYDSGKLDGISVMGSNEVKMNFAVKRPGTVTDLTKDSRKQETVQAGSASALRRVSESYRKLRFRFSEYESKASVAESRNPDYLRSLDGLSENIEIEKSLLNPDSLPSDSLQLYRELFSKLNIKVLDFRSEVLKLMLSQPENSGTAGTIAGQRINDSLRKLIRTRFESLVTGQIDSLSRLAENQKSVSAEILTLISDSKSRRKSREKIDSLVSNHQKLKNDFSVLQESHSGTWRSYRIALGNLVPVGEIETAHSAFIVSQNDLQSAIDQADRRLAAVQPEQSDTPWYLSTKMLWVALALVLLLVFVSAIWSSARSRKFLMQGLAAPEPGNGSQQPVKSQGTGLFAGELADEYFTLDYQDSIPESAVGIVHFNPSSIKSVYHLVQSALLEKRGNDFGGYLFGSQYRLHGKGTSRNELFVEKVCDSKYLRSLIANDISERADLVEELDALVADNKKLRLIGWFTSSLDASMEVPEGLMKVHRSFFKEKWQIGILLNPASDLLQGAGFFRRKTGYLDPMPDPAAFIKWDELYRFALNPASNTKRDAEDQDPDRKNYSRIDINTTWGDSIVTSVNFDPNVVAEIMNVAANQAIPKDNYQIVGYLYGKVVTRSAQDNRPDEFDVYVSRFIELANESAPRELPGLALVGWWGQAHIDVMNYLYSAVGYHEKTFREAHQFACLVNPTTGELRIFTRKHSLEMNNSTIETEEYQLNSLLSR